MVILRGAPDSSSSYKNTGCQRKKGLLSLSRLSRRAHAVPFRVEGGPGFRSTADYEYARQDYSNGCRLDGHQVAIRTHHGPRVRFGVGGAGSSQADAPARLTNISTRSLVQTGAQVMIGGFIIGGSTPKTVMVRAIGPALATFGVPGALANPVLQLFSGQAPIAENDDWETPCPCAGRRVGRPPPSPPPGSRRRTTWRPPSISRSPRGNTPPSSAASGRCRRGWRSSTCSRCPEGSAPCRAPPSPAQPRRGRA